MKNRINIVQVTLRSKVAYNCKRKTPKLSCKSYGFKDINIIE